VDETRAAEGPGEAGPHVGSKRLIAYRQGRLPAAEREAVQEHLSLCARCTGLLRELRDFEAASAASPPSPPSPNTATAGHDALREEAWDSLVQRLRGKTPGIRPVTAFPRPRRGRYFVHLAAIAAIAAAALLLAVVGLSVLARSEHRRLEEREAALAGAQRALAEIGHQLDAARGRLRDLEKSPSQTEREKELAARVADLTSKLEALRRQPAPDRLAAAGTEVGISLAPRFVLRGQEAPETFLSAGGAVNPVPIHDGRVTVALDLSDSSAYPEIRLELLDGTGKILWSGRRPTGAILGDDGTSVSIAGLGPGRYRLRIEGLAEYRLDVEPE
jgi:hypothetical protein